MLLRARWLLPVSGPPLRDGGLLLREGRIEALGAFEDLQREHPEAELRDLGGAALLPGLVNPHAHVEITGLRRALLGLPFAEWIPELVRLRRTALEPVDDLISSELGCLELLRAGITTVGDCAHSPAPPAALRSSGLRAVVFREAFSPAPEGAAAALEEMRGFVAAADDEDESRVRTGLSPHSPYTAVPDFLRDAAELAVESGRPISVHCAESEAERAFLRDGTGPIARIREAGPIRTGLTPVEHFERLGWFQLPVPVQLVHLCTASELELDILAERARHAGGPQLTACPRSNLRLGNGAPALADWSARGLPWSLGTDGAPSCGSLDLFDELRTAARLLEQAGRPAGARELLRRVTLDAAAALGLEGDVGSLEPGKRADLLAVTLDAPRFDPEGDPEAAIVEAAGPADVRMVMVDGELLLDGDELTRVDEARIRARGRERAERLAGLAR